MVLTKGDAIAIQRVRTKLTILTGFCATLY
jgi:hypothetical protein